MTKLHSLGLLSALGLAARSMATFAIVNLPSRFEQGFSLEERVYGPRPWDTLDVYTPTGPGPWDVVVFFHGGRWSYGRKDNYRFVGSALSRAGYLTIIPNYRKYPQVRFPDFVGDGAKALAWVHDHASSMGGRPGRLHLAGHSSGAHIGALLTADKTYLSSEGKSARDVITSFAGLAGPYDFTPRASDLVDIFGPPEAFSQMRVTTFIDGSEPPMLLLYGAADETVAPFNHERLANRIRMKGGKVEVVVYPDLGHIEIVGSLSWLIRSGSVLKDMARFFSSKGNRAR